MKKRLIAIITIMFMFTSCIVASADKTTSEQKEIKLDKTVKVVEKDATKGKTYIDTNSLAIVESPTMFLNKNVSFQATFDKFATLGLDYTPAMRESQKYISFLIKRDDVTDHTIPLSEMKLFITKDYAEKFIELDSGDKIKIYGKVFSTALTDAWLDVDKIVILEKKENKKQ